MSQNDAQSKKVLALSAGICVVLGFAGWSLNSALSPETAPAPAPEPQEPARARGASVSGTGHPGTTDEVEHVLPPPTTRDAAAPGDAASADEFLAQHVDPFAPIQTPSDPKASAPAAVMAVRTGGAARPSAFVSGWGPLVPVLPPGGGSVPPRVAEEELPPLVGTLLGNRPSAVFQGDRQVQIVAQGEAIGSWRVVSVSHGAAVVKGNGRTRRLAVGGARSQAPVRVETAAKGPAAVEPQLEMMATLPEVSGRPMPEPTPKPAPPTDTAASETPAEAPPAPSEAPPTPEPAPAPPPPAPPDEPQSP